MMDGGGINDEFAGERHETVNHPQHYSPGSVEVIDAIEAWRLGFHLGNVVKYVARAGKKGDSVEDLRKAQWYLDRAVAFMGGEETQSEAERVIRNLLAIFDSDALKGACTIADVHGFRCSEEVAQRHQEYIDEARALLEVP